MLWLNMNRYVLYSYLVWLSIKSVSSHKTWLSQWLLFMAPALCRINKNDSYEYESLSFILFVAIFVFPWSVFWSGSYWSIKPESEVSSKKYWDLWYRKDQKNKRKIIFLQEWDFYQVLKLVKFIKYQRQCRASIKSWIICINYQGTFS